MEVLVNLRFDENGAQDLAGKAWHDAISSFSPFSETGRFGGKAVNLSGNEYMSCSQAINLGTQEFTLSFHVNPRLYSKTRRGIFSGGIFDSVIAIYLIDSSNKENCVLLRCAGFNEAVSELSISNNTWSHIALIREKGEKDILSLYINGKLAIQGNINTTQSLNIAAGQLAIGYAQEGCYRGLLDDLCIIKDEALWTSEFTPPTTYLLTPTKKLYLKNSEAWGMSNGVFTKLADDYNYLTDAEREALFSSENPAIADLTALKRIRILKYNEANSQPQTVMTAVPKPKLALPKGLISLESFEGIDKASLTSNISANASCRLLVTTDLATYQTYDVVNQVWQAVDHTNITDVMAIGIDAAELSNIPCSAWDVLTNGKSGIGFAYLLSIEDTTDICNIDKLELTVDMKGAWNKAIHGTDYTYGYPQNNLLRVNLLSNGDYKINYQK